MTTGTRITDNLAAISLWNHPHPGNPTLAGTGYVGGYWKKTWSGTDAPPNAKPTERELYPVWDAVRKKYVWRWRKIRAVRQKRYVDPHPYTCSIESYSDAEYAYWHKDFYPPYGNTFDGNRTFRFTYGKGYSVTRNYDVNNGAIAMRGKLREKIVGSEFNMGVFLGEGREALRMIFNAATQLRKALQAARRFDVAGMYKAVGAAYRSSQTTRKGKLNEKFVFERWLEAQYGWLPLLGDAEDGAKALAKILNFPMCQKYRVRSRFADTGVTNSWTIKSYELECFTHAQIIAEIYEVDIPGLIGLTDPASVAWELVPFSFVADWFIPIGNYLAARGLASSLTGRFTETVVYKEYFQCDKLDNGSQTIYTKQAYYRSKYISMNRTVSTTLSVPKPRIKPLGMVPSWKRAANAVSLLVVTGAGMRSWRQN